MPVIENGDLDSRLAKQKNELSRRWNHEFKNNLQLIVSLISIQADQTEHPDIRAALEAVEGRVRAIAGIYERVYTSAASTEVQMSACLEGLVGELCAARRDQAERIRFIVDVDDMVLSTGQALPLALIANELIGNSLRHAFPHERGGTLAVSLKYVSGSFEPARGETADNGLARLSVVDDGIGMPSEAAPSGGIGLYLVDLLVQQLRGTKTRHDALGVNTAITFPLHAEP